MISLGREITGDLEAAIRREWLVTNGIGGFASGTVAGMNTRRYHGLLFAALKPPLGRALVLARLDEQVTLDGQVYELTTNEWAGGIIRPRGYKLLESFHLEGSIPVFSYALKDALLQKRVWMAHGANTTYVTYSLVRGRRPIQLGLLPIGGLRDYHSHNAGTATHLAIDLVEQGVQVEFGPGSPPYWLLTDRGRFHIEPTWYWNFYHRVEAYRGLDTAEDLFSPGRFNATLEPGDTLTFAVTLHKDTDLDGATAYQTEWMRQVALLQRANLQDQPAWVEQLVLAADQFVVDRPIPNHLHSSPQGQVTQYPTGQSVIAGYHWFGDWGRDTMISLPGLALSTGRPEVAATVLHTFARYVDRGMLPNRFPDLGEEPEYNTVDATLWYFDAVYQFDRYLAEKGDKSIPEAERDLVTDLYPTLADVIEWHLRGTRYGIKVDERDGLLSAGEPGVQLTWMDAKVDDWVVTPRQGKPVEINALWYNALRVLADFARRLDKPDAAARWDEMADRVAASFQERFWYAGGGYLYDVVDGPDGDDAKLRPNQLLAVSLPHGPLSSEQARSMVDVCARTLLTSYGLRSLAPGSPGYTGEYGGDRWRRDGAYHQGTVWGWLIGPFVEAHYKVYGDAEAARSFLRPFARHLSDHGLGSVSEIFDGGPPHAPRGCIAQAWSVAEVLRVWLVVNG
jgi:predicted glycogen debranching enzyme